MITAWFDIYKLYSTVSLNLLCWLPVYPQRGYGLRAVRGVYFKHFKSPEEVKVITISPPKKNIHGHPTGVTAPRLGVKYMLY